MNWADNYLQHPELPATTPEERAKYAAHFELLKEWNTRFNLVSRKSNRKRLCHPLRGQFVPCRPGGEAFYR
jgi:16S rRNA G527 N7-methylase RsmG